MNTQHIKSVSRDKRGSNRLRFSSAKKRSQQASADVYRSYKRRIGVTTSAANREEQVHQESSESSKKKKARLLKDDEENQLLYALGDGNESEASTSDDILTSTFASELDVALDRNASEIFAKFHREVWPLVRSLPEILHHSNSIVDLLLSHMLSNESSHSTEVVSPDKRRSLYIVNLATIDILHLLAVLARDLRHEIHPYIHKAILPRILYDLLSPPSPDSGKQPIPLEVEIVETAFRTMSYIFRYDAAPLLAEVEKEGQEPCLELMRKYYGVTLAHRRDLVRRLSAETFAPLIRRLPNDTSRKKHLKRVIRALVVVSKQQSTSPSAKRMQTDAAGGISSLLFEVSRGVKGMLHSKGVAVVKCLLECVSSEIDGSDGSSLVSDIASGFLSRLCRHLDSSNATIILQTIVGYCKNMYASGASDGDHPLSCLLQLVQQMVSYQGGRLIQNDDPLVDELTQFVSHLLEKTAFHQLSGSCQSSLMNLMCSVWVAIPHHKGFVATVSDRIRHSLRPESSTTRLSPSEAQSIISLATILVRGLLTHLPAERAMLTVGSAVFSAAGYVVALDADAALSLVHSIVMATRSYKPEGEDSDLLFDLSYAKYCITSASEIEQLLGSLMASNGDVVTHCGRMAEVVECVSFLALVGSDEVSTNDASKRIRKVASWLLHLAESIVSNEEYARNGQIATHLSVLLSIVLECFASITDVVLSRGGIADSNLRQAAWRSRRLAEKHLVAKSDSSWAVKSVAAVGQVLVKLGMKIETNSNVVFDALIPNLHHSNHFMRLHSLQILAVLPPRPYVTDHAQLDLIGDLDEEPSEVSSSLEKTNGPSGMSEVPALLLHIESTGLSVSGERALLSHISRLEVLGKTGRIPVVHAEAAASHLLGLLYSKFSPVWPAAIKALVALATGHEDSVWPWVNKKLVKLTRCNPNCASPDLLDQSGPVSHFESCVSWDIAGDTSLFRADIDNARESGLVSRHDLTDSVTVFESSWSVIERAPWLMTKHSKSLVQLFVRFMHEQYFGEKQDDADARELQLAQQVDPDSRKDSDRCLEKWVVQRRLVAMLKAFSSVKGPQQLSKHSLLRSIFTTLLSHSETTVSQLAFACLLRFNDTHLHPYSDNIRELFAKGKLRESLLRLKTLAEADSFAAEDRTALVPILGRILFGRLSAKAMVKSAKDSPAARRNAVLSFLNCFCIDDDELYPFLYLIIRAYIPRDHSMKPVEYHDVGFREKVIEHILSLTPDDVKHTLPALHQGFLNMLEAVLEQLGFRVAKFVPVFIAIILAIAKAYEVKTQDQTHGIENSSARSSNVRALCYRRIADILERFHASIDFESFFKGLWESIRGSISLLPEMAVSSGSNVPSLLQCVVTLSTQRTFVSFLDVHDDVVPCVLRCINASSCSAVVQLVLSFVSNLLGRSEEESGTGPYLISRHVGVLLTQFRVRLESSCVAINVSNQRGKPSVENQTWRQELSILSRVSKLLGSDTMVKAENDVLDSLCHVLFPFLECRRLPEADQLNVLEILCSIASRISASFGPEYYTRLSRLLGLSEKARPGIQSKEVRQSLASVLRSLTLSIYRKATRCSAVVVDLCALHPNRINELDYEKVLSALVMLCEKEQWNTLCSNGEKVEPSLLLPIVHISFHFLYDSDGVVVRSSFNALKALVSIATDNIFLNEDSAEADNDSAVSNWIKLLQGCLVSIARDGLHCRNESIRRFFVLIMREISIRCSKSRSPHLYGDLAMLTREDDPDLDFFLNITHVQIHRRARALLRLRKILLSDDASFSLHSLSNVLLPLTIHPVYESTAKTEESLVLESISTAGSIARSLSWSKYNGLLSTTLNQLHRHPEQERYIVALLCAIIDAFHFDDRAASNTTTSDPDGGSAVLRALETRIIPKVESLLVKEKMDRNGEKVKSLRSSIVLALLKLFQKMPEETFRTKLPRLLSVICDVLKSRDSGVRDTARTTLAKMVSSMDIVYLADVMRELALSLTEGYQLHVRSATIHSILLDLSNVHNKTVENQMEGSVSAFDRAVPGLVDLLQQDLFGIAQERKEARGNQVRYVKEAGGSKSYHSLELIALMIHFRPSDSSRHQSQSSSVHALVSPFLERLRDPKVGSSMIRRIRECLIRVVSGFSRNPTVHLDEVLVFVYATIGPFISQSEVDQVLCNSIDEEGDDDPGSIKPIVVSGGMAGKKSLEAPSKAKARVSEWRPSMLDTPRSADNALKMKYKAENDFSRVSDGASAPKLTGSNRLRIVSAPPSVNNPSSVSAIVFGLQLLHAGLKKSKQVKSEEYSGKLDPFVPLLTACVCVAKELDIVVLALKTLGLFLRVDLPSRSRCACSLATKCLEFLTSSGSSSNQHQEIVQASFKMLSSLFDLDRTQYPESTKIHPQVELPLSSEQMQVLLSFLRSSILDFEQHTAAMNLVKSITARMYVSTELYDLMETLLEQSVRSTKPSLRQQSASLFVNYLLDFPLSPERIEQHLKQIVLNLKYEYAEGRLAALALLSTVIERVPVPVVEEHYSLFFLPLTLQLVNDDSEGCRESVARTITLLMTRLPYGHQVSLCDYVVRWSDAEGDLKRTGLQLCGILIDCCPDTLKRRNIRERLIAIAQEAINDQRYGWEVPYFALVFLEKAATSLSNFVNERHDLWVAVVNCLSGGHPWIRLVASRVLTQQLTSIDLTLLGDPSSKVFLVKRPGALYDVARGFCHQLGLDDDEQDEAAITLAIKSLSWVSQAMDRYPELCFREAETEETSEGKGSRDPVAWVLTRLAMTAKRKGSKRRQAVFKFFAALATMCCDVVNKHLELILEPLHRCELEARNELEAQNVLYKKHVTTKGMSEEAQLAKSVLQLLEERCSAPEEFLRAYAAVKTRARSRKEKRKVEAKTEAVRDPQSAAARRLQKQEREKKRRKRRIEDKRRDRGAEAKRRFGA